MFRGINGPFKATRYHSLMVERGNHAGRRSASPRETDDGLIMGALHKTLPVHGVQFHPESIASEHGHLILKNFLDLAAQWNATTGRRAAAQDAGTSGGVNGRSQGAHRQGRDRRAAHARGGRARHSTA